MRCIQPLSSCKDHKDIWHHTWGLSFLHLYDTVILVLAWLGGSQLLVSWVFTVLNLDMVGMVSGIDSTTDNSLCSHCCIAGISPCLKWFQSWLHCCQFPVLPLIVQLVLPLWNYFEIFLLLSFPRATPLWSWYCLVYETVPEFFPLLPLPHAPPLVWLVLPLWNGSRINSTTAYSLCSLSCGWYCCVYEIILETIAPLPHWQLPPNITSC